MKRLALLFFVLMAALTASAQYMPVEGTLSRKGTKVFAEGRRLTKGEISATLSMFSDDNGVGYDVRWTKASRTYNAGIALTTLGGVATVVGGAFFSYGFIYMVTAGTAFTLYSPIFVFAGQEPDIDSQMAAATNMMAVGFLVCVAGAAMLGAGIPLICVFKGRMNRIIQGHNAQYSGNVSNDVTLNFGPTRNGIGLALNF